MQIVQVKFRGMESIKNFVNILTNYDNDFDIVDERYVIDAKSIMGLFSLNLSHPLNLKIYSEDEKVINEVVEKLTDYQYIA